MKKIKNIINFQFSSIKTAINYLKSCKKKKIDITTSPYCDFVTWADGLGFENFLLLIKKKKLNLKFLKFFLYESLFIRNNYELINFNSDLNYYKKINVVYSYCSEDSFDSKGVFFDKYFNENNKKNKNTFWFLISLDNFVPKYGKNIFIIKRKKNYFGFFYNIKFILSCLFKKNFFHICNNTSNYSKIISTHFYNTFKNKKFNLYLPFENRPHQNSIIKKTKYISKENKVFGYLHPMPWSFQLDMIYKNKLLDKLYVCSKIQKKVLARYFLWPLKKIKIINSLRYDKLTKRNNCIFLPYEISNKEKFYINSIKIFFDLSLVSTNNLKISIHPLKSKNLKHIQLKKKILETISLSNSKNSLKKNYPLILGAPGGVVSECLQTIGKVYHITDNSFDIFSSEIWKNIKTKKISSNLYEYTILNKQNLIETNNKTNNFSKLLKQN